MTKDIENREWLNDYPALKQVNKNNPFTVPDSYFSELGDHIAAGIRFEELKSKMPLTGFTVPENYFEELSGNIQSRINIEKVLGENAGFTVPENYFEQLNDKITSRIFVEEALAENTGFTVPENYFEELSSQITSRIFVEEALAGSADSFAVPQDYFNKLNQSILNKTVNQPEAVKQKGVVVRMFSSVAFKYATAACLVLMVGTGVLLNRVFSPAAIHNRSSLHQQLANVPIDAIQSYLELNVDDTQHTVASEGLSGDDANLDDALQNISDSNQK